MKQPVLILLKPDCLAKNAAGIILTKVAETKLDFVGMKLVRVSQQLAEAHYQHLRKKPFFDEMINYILGKYHRRQPLLAMVLWGENAIKKCRKLAGATNPEEADHLSIRGTLGRITTKGIFENVIHVSESLSEARREIKLWFKPEELLLDVLPTQKEVHKNYAKRVWK